VRTALETVALGIGAGALFGLFLLVLWWPL
jgi:hypothetical protein